MQDKSRAYGLLICIGTVIAAVFFIWGIKNQNYWAVAIPVIIGLLTLLGLAFWIGWTIVTIKSDVSSMETLESTPAGQSEEAADDVTEEESSES